MFRLPFQITRAVNLFKPVISKTLENIGIPKQISSKIQNRCISNSSRSKTFNIQHHQTRNNMCKYVNNIIPIVDSKRSLLRKPNQLLGIEKVESKTDIRSFHNLTNPFDNKKLIPTCEPQKKYLSKQLEGTPVENMSKKGTLICTIKPSKELEKEMKRPKKRRSKFKKRPIPGCPELDDDGRIICMCKKMELPRKTCRLIEKEEDTNLSCCAQPPEEEPYTVECKPVYTAKSKPQPPKK